MRRFWIAAVLAIAFVATVTTAGSAGHYIGLHWSDDDPNFPRGYIYWDDNTGAEWPVFSAAVVWDQVGELDAVYVSSASSCPSHCVSVNEVDMHPQLNCANGNLGQMIPASNSDGHLNGNTVIRIDQDCSGMTAANRRELMCHEMGHSVGLDERLQGAVTCMRQGFPVGRQNPNTHDFNMLDTIYNHNDPG